MKFAALAARSCTRPVLRAHFSIQPSISAGLPPPKLIDSERELEVVPNSDPSEAACFAFYSSYLGGVTRDPNKASVPIDDHGFHRGHCVFDTANVTKSGQVYALDQHLHRLSLSANAAGIKVPSRDDMRSAVLGTVAAGGKHLGKCSFVRYWLTSGRGNFSISPAKCQPNPGFFVVVHKDTHCLDIPAPSVAAVTTTIPLKPANLATMKTNNYLINALVAMDAESQGADLGIQLDDNDCITESSVSTIGIVTTNGDDLVFVVPPFDRILASTTVSRAMALMPNNILISGKTYNLHVEQRSIQRQEIFSAREVIDFGGHFCRPVSHVDGFCIGKREDGSRKVYEAIATALMNDMDSNQMMLDDVDYDSFDCL